MRISPVSLVQVFVRIPNLLGADDKPSGIDGALPRLYEYRRQRYSLHTDDKELTAWNSLMIAALCSLYRVSRNARYLDAAVRAGEFVESELSSGDTLRSGARGGRRMGEGFLDDYAAYIHALIALHGATLNESYLLRADAPAKKAVDLFFDDANGGFFLSGRAHETLVLRPKESYDGAMPSGNSLMAYDLARLERLRPNEERGRVLQKQVAFLSSQAAAYPAGYCMFLTALCELSDPPAMITVSPAGVFDAKELPFVASLRSSVRLLPAPTGEHPLLNGKTTFYICRGGACLPPTNDIGALRA